MHWFAPVMCIAVWYVAGGFLLYPFPFMISLFPSSSPSTHSFTITSFLTLLPLSPYLLCISFFFWFSLSIPLVTFSCHAALGLLPIRCTVKPQIKSSASHALPTLPSPPLLPFLSYHFLFSLSLPPPSFHQVERERGRGGERGGYALG